MKVGAVHTTFVTFSNFSVSSGDVTNQYSAQIAL